MGTISDHKFWLAVNIYHEARGEPVEGQVAIGHVVINRALKRKKTVKDIILAPWQFSWHNGKAFPPIADYDALRASLNVAEMVIEERLSGKDLWRADHYYAEYIPEPKWAKGMTQVAKIGRHLFFRE